MLFAETMSEVWKNWATTIGVAFTIIGVLVSACAYFIRLRLQKTYQRLSVELNPIVVRPTDQQKETRIVGLECVVKNEADCRIDFADANYELSYIENEGKETTLKGKFQHNLIHISPSEASWSVDASSTVTLLAWIEKPTLATTLRFKGTLSVKWTDDIYITEKIIVITQRE